MIRGSDFILNPNKLEEQFQLVEVSDWVDFFYKRKARLLLYRSLSKAEI